MPLIVQFHLNIIQMTEGFDEKAEKVYIVNKYMVY